MSINEAAKKYYAHLHNSGDTLLQINLKKKLAEVAANVDAGRLNPITVENQLEKILKP